MIRIYLINFKAEDAHACAFNYTVYVTELGEGWEENSEAVTEGVSFYLKYLGSTLLEELPLGESYGEGVSSKAVQAIVNMVNKALLLNL